MSSNNPRTNKRIVKTMLPAELIASIDVAVSSGRSGLATRDAFIEEAIQNLLKDIDYPEAQPDVRQTGYYAGEAYQPPSSRGPETSEEDHQWVESVELDRILREVPAIDRDHTKLGDAVGSALALRIDREPTTSPPRSPGTATRKVQLTTVGPFLGFHNRDYPSLWALSWLARYEADEPVGFKEFLDRITPLAWYVGAQASHYDSRLGGFKRSALFPTNFAKQPSAERKFQHFAVGSFKYDGKVFKTDGPLFAWQAIELYGDEPSPKVGVTAAGLELLEMMAGITLELPHSNEQAKLFLGYLAEHAPGDSSGFKHLLRITKEEVGRDAVIEEFGAAFPDWDHRTAGAVVQGYVARAREWGLLEMKLVNGQYQLTEFGHGFVAGEHF